MFLNDKLEIKLGDFGLATKLEFDGEKKKLYVALLTTLPQKFLMESVGTAMKSISGL